MHSYGDKFNMKVIDFDDTYNFLIDFYLKLFRRANNWLEFWTKSKRKIIELLIVISVNWEGKVALHEVCGL